MLAVADPPAEAMVSPVEVLEIPTFDPVPVRATVCGEPAALLMMLRVPVRVPAVVGEKVTEMMQFAPAATLVPQVLVSAKSPEAEMDVMFKAAWPELVKVTVWAVLIVPVSCEANVRLAGDSVTEGTAEATTTDIADELAVVKLASPA